MFLYLASFFLPVVTSIDDQVLFSFSSKDFLGFRAALGLMAIMFMFVNMGLSAQAAMLFGLGALLTSTNLFMLFSLFYVPRNVRPPRLLSLLAILSIIGALLPLPMANLSDEPTRFSIGYYCWAFSVVCVALMVLKEGKLSLMAKEDLAVLREKLLNVNGIGPETADSMLLYAFDQPTFVVDAYTKRFMSRHRWIEHDHDYHGVQRIFHSELKRDHQYFNEYHALIVRLAKDFCRTKAVCEGCPLNKPKFWKSKA